MRASLVAIALLGAAVCAHAASLTVTVVDNAGKPLSDAVVMLEPIGGRLSVKPMAPVDVGQSKRRFVPQVTVVTVGTPVNFPNFDTVRHHVYSFSPIKTFELKLYAGAPNAPIVFDKPGTAVLGCNIHDQMAAWIVVVDTPFHASTAADGQVRLDNVPSGSYRLRAWHAGVPAGKEPAADTLNLAGTDMSAQIKLPASLL
jgi:plastocyanin